MNTRRTVLPSFRTTASRAQFSPLRGSVSPRISVMPVEPIASSPARRTNAAAKVTRLGSADAKRASLLTSDASKESSRSNAQPVKITIADFPVSSPRTLDSGARTADIGRLWTPGLLDRLQSPLTRYRE